MRVQAVNSAARAPTLAAAALGAYNIITEASKENRTATRNARILENDAYGDQERVVHEAGMDM